MAGPHELNNNTEDMLGEIKAFIESSSGLQVGFVDNGKINVTQSSDQKVIALDRESINDILHRSDGDGKAFIQVNFVDGQKILITDRLIGFKPVATHGLDMNRLPKVVTTPDIVSVFEALEEAISSESGAEEEVEILKKVFESILNGGEAIGFHLSKERMWLERLVITPTYATA